MFVWLGVALAVDTIDGPLTRHLRVTTVLPRCSGERLDLIVDFLTYVAVPGLRLNPSGPPTPGVPRHRGVPHRSSGQFTLCAAREPHERGLWPWTSEGGYAFSSGVKAARANPPQRNDDRFPGRSACLGKLHCLERMEVVLGIDNVVFISVMISRMPPAQRLVARRVGLSLALMFRVAMLAGIIWFTHLTKPVFTAFGYDFSWRDLILIAGGLFLLWKATREIHSDIEGDADTKRLPSSTRCSPASSRLPSSISSSPSI